MQRMTERDQQLERMREATQDEAKPARIGCKMSFEKVAANECNYGHQDASEPDRAAPNGIATKSGAQIRASARGGGTHLIESGTEDFAPEPYHTSGRAVFSHPAIERAAFYIVSARSDGGSLRQQSDGLNRVSHDMIKLALELESDSW